MPSIIDVGGDDLARLSGRDAVDLFADLLWAEAHAVAAGLDMDIDVPRVTDAPDGGIDATVKAPLDAAAEPGAIRPGTTRYQIETEKGLNPATMSGIRRLLFRSGSANELKPRIRRCLDGHERLVIVLFGTDTPAAGDDGGDAEDMVRRALVHVDPSYSNADVEVWRQNRLIGYIGRHPALQRRLKGTAAFSFVDHAHWSPVQAGMDPEFVMGRSQRDLVERARAALLRTDAGADVRIVGAPGCGKTRIAYEITNVAYLAPMVLYFEYPRLLRDGGFFRALIEDRAARAILVVDECDTKSWLYLSSKVDETGGRIKLVTIHTRNDGDDCYELEDLGLAEIRKIIARYGARVPDETLDGLANACRPSPRYAHHFAKMLALDPDGPAARGLGAGAIHERYLEAGLGENDADRARKRKSVLLWFSLFARVGYEAPHSDESDFLRKKCREMDGIAPHEFDTIVDELRSLKILQGSGTLYIAPWMLHLWLWREWWRIHGRGSSLDDFAPPGGGPGSGPEMPGALRRSFREMLESDPRPGGVSEAARTLLGRSGPFADGTALEGREGAKTFRAAARAAPDSALRLLGETLCGWDDGRLGRFGEGRRHVVWAVAQAARETRDVGRAAEVLLCLAANENERGLANNATGVFARLFSMPPAALADTQASAADRLALLSRLLRDADGRRRALALAACDSALESVHTGRIEYERNPALWRTAGWRPGGDEQDYYRQVVSLLCGVLDGGGERERRRAAAVLLKRAAELSVFEPVSAAIVKALRLALDRGAADRAKVAQAADLVLRTASGSMGRDAADSCRRLALELAGGDDYRSRMRRHVAAAVPGEVARLPAEPDGAAAGEMLAGLAAESLRNRGALLGQADWLFGPGVRHALQFGAALAERDGGCELLPGLIGAMEGAAAEPSGELIGGYLGVVSRRDEAAWDSAMDALEGSARLAPLVPRVVWLSRITDRSWGRLVRMHGRGALPSDDICIFAYGGRACALSDRAFAEALEMLLEDPPASGMRAPLALLSARCGCGGDSGGGGGNGRGGGRAIPPDLARRVVLDDAFLAGPRDGRGRGRDSVAMGPCVLDWATVAKRLILDDPGQVQRMAGPVLEAMGSARGVFSGHHNGVALGALDLMTSIAPELVWSRVAGMVAAPPDPTTYRLLDWAGGHDRRAPDGARAAGAPSPVPLLDAVAPESVWAWVDGDRDVRAECLAKFAPRSVEPGLGPITRGLLSRYGGDGRVREALHRNFCSTVWIGSAAGRLAAARQRCEELAAAESDPLVKAWLGERIRTLADLSADRLAIEERASLT